MSDQVPQVEQEDIINSDDFVTLDILDGQIMLSRSWRLYQRPSLKSNDLVKLAKSKGKFVLKLSSNFVYARRSVKDGEDEIVGPLPLLTREWFVREKSGEIVRKTSETSLEQKGIVRRLL